MEAATAPVSLKGMREPLLLLATGLFISFVLTPITGMIGAAGIALGLRDLRKCESASALGRWSVIGEIAAWCTCALWILALTGVNLLSAVGVITQTVALCSAAIALERLARAAGATSLVRVFLFLGWLPLALPILVGMALSLPPAAPTLILIAFLFHAVACICLAVLALRVRSLAVPYGRRIASSAA